MESTAIFVRTAKGQHKLVHGYFDLTREQRKLLTLINGKTTIGELAQKFAAESGIETMLHALEDQGIIEQVEGSAAQAQAWAAEAARASSTQAPPQTVAQPAPATAVTQPNLATLKPLIQTIIENHFGPMAGPYIVKLRACNSLEHLQGFLSECRIVIAEAINKDRADAFWRKVLMMTGYE